MTFGGFKIEGWAVHFVYKVAFEEDNEDWIRKNIFHTKYTFHGKVCLMIIDGGSFENVVPLEMVQKLNLETIAHPTQYKLCGLQKSVEIKVSKRCLISLSIGKNYHDKDIV